jgi:hypothetical protein
LKPHVVSTIALSRRCCRLVPLRLDAAHITSFDEVRLKDVEKYVAWIEERR